MPNRHQLLEELRILNDEYRIVFKGPVPASHYSQEYPAYHRLFTDIRRISRTYFDKYGQIDNIEDLAADEKRLQVQDLTDIAYQCRLERLNEEGWIREIEPRVVHRLSSGVICRRCRNHLWKAAFEALPVDAAEAEKLQRRRTRRSLCLCGITARASHNKHDPGNGHIFSNRSDEKILHEVEAQLPIRLRTFKRPDRVYGLRLTKTLAYYASERRTLTHSPFKDRKILYPFLVIEAKSEKGSPGFESIETQSALAIRTCLVLQRDLEAVTGIPLHPLVWFIAYQGDEWRLYAGMPDGEAFSVIDLWHGHILSQDGALQLLLIIDFICTWARDVYRPGILRCLAGGATHLREITPANTQISMEDDDEETAEDVNEPINVLLAMRQNRESAQAIQDIVDEMDFDSGETAAEHTDVESHDINGDNLARISLDESQSLNDITGGMAIQKAECSEMVWKQMILPSGTDEMLEFLRVTKPNSAPQVAARELLRIFLDNRLTVTATSHWMSSLEHRVWSRPSPRFVEPETPVRVVMHGYSHFNGFNWKIIRQLTCLVCSQDAASALANISEDLSIVVSITQWTAHDCGCLEERWEEFQSLQGRRAVVAALTQLEIGLQHDVETENEGHPKWVSCDEVRWKAIERWDVNAVLGHLESASGTAKACLKILRWDSESAMSSSSRFQGTGLIDTSSVDDVPGLFVKRPANWDVSCPTWCFVRLDDRDGRSWEVWELAAAALEGGAVYAARSDDGEIASADWAFLTHWIRQMKTSRGETRE